MGLHAEALLHARPTPATVLASVVWQDRHHLPTGACCLVGEDGPKLTPARIADALAEATVPHQIGDPQVFQVDIVVLAQQGKRGLVVKVPALSSDFLMVLGQQSSGFLAALAPLLPIPRRRRRRIEGGRVQQNGSSLCDLDKMESRRARYSEESQR